MKKIISIILTVWLISTSACGQTTIYAGKYLRHFQKKLQYDSLHNATWENLATENYVAGYVATHAGPGGGGGLSGITSQDTANWNLVFRNMFKNQYFRNATSAIATSGSIFRAKSDSEFYFRKVATVCISGCTVDTTGSTDSVLIHNITITSITSFDGDSVLLRGTITNQATVDIDFSAFATRFKRIEIQFYSIVLGTSSADLYCRFSNDGTTFLTTSNYGYVHDWTRVGSSSQNVTSSFSSADHGILFQSVDIGAGKYLQGHVILEDPAASHFLTVEGAFKGWVQGAGTERHDLTVLYEQSGTFKGFRIYASSGNINSGGYRVIGTK